MQNSMQLKEEGKACLGRAEVWNLEKNSVRFLICEGIIKEKQKPLTES